MRAPECRTNWIETHVVFPRSVPHEDSSVELEGGNSVTVTLDGGGSGRANCRAQSLEPSPSDGRSRSKVGSRLRPTLGVIRRGRRHSSFTGKDRKDLCLIVASYRLVGALPLTRGSAPVKIPASRQSRLQEKWLQAEPWSERGVPEKPKKNLATPFPTRYFSSPYSRTRKRSKAQPEDSLQ